MHIPSLRQRLLTSKVSKALRKAGRRFRNNIKTIVKLYRMCFNRHVSSGNHVNWMAAQGHHPLLHGLDTVTPNTGSNQAILVRRFGHMRSWTKDRQSLSLMRQRSICWALKVNQCHLCLQWTSETTRNEAAYQRRTNTPDWYGQLEHRHGKFESEIQSIASKCCLVGVCKELHDDVKQSFGFDVVEAKQLQSSDDKKAFEILNDVRKGERPIEVGLLSYCIRDTRDDLRHQLRAMRQHYVRNKNAESYSKKQYPRAYEAIKEAITVDDYIDSTNSEDEAIEVASKSSTDSSEGGFEIRNWASNSASVLKQLKDINTATQSQSVRRDGEGFRSSCRSFDPLGLVSCYTVGLKILLQRVWKTLDGIKSYRNLFSTNGNSGRACCRKFKQLKSQDAIHTTWRRQHASSCIHSLMQANMLILQHATYALALTTPSIACLWHLKNKVAPLKPVSIPRMELQAVGVACITVKKVCNARGLKIDKITYWSDSRRFYNG
ncbi:hypothetical protein ACLKA6_011478 [Drosophila palustris]